MELAGYIAALFIGISLGLIGGGGSILTIPLLVYLFHIEPTLATGYSLFIVGCSSLTGAWKNFREGNVDVHAAVYFGPASILATVLVRKLLLPAIPEQLFAPGHYVITKSTATMILFAVVMIIASFGMIRKDITQPKLPISRHSHLIKAVMAGLFTGILTGLLGAGGGFIIIPVLLFSFRLTMKKAIGTSLLIIAMNALLGFAGDLFHHQYNWLLLLTITAIAISGTYIGSKFGQNIKGSLLKKSFGWFVLVMGVYIMIHELMIR